MAHMETCAKHANLERHAASYLLCRKSCIEARNHGPQPSTILSCNTRNFPNSTCVMPKIRRLGPSVLLASGHPPNRVGAHVQGLTVMGCLSTTPMLPGFPPKGGLIKGEFTGGQRREGG